MFKRDDIDALSDNRKASDWAVGISVVICSAAYFFALFFWLSADATLDLRINRPGEDGKPLNAGPSGPLAVLKGVFQKFDGVASNLPGTWPGFRGPNFDNIVDDSHPLASAWPDEGPEILWSVDIGDGYAAPAVMDGAAYMIDYDMENKADTIRAFSLETGEEIWRRSYAIKVKRNHGMSRTVPAVTDKYLVTIGPRGHTVCLDRETGDFRWGLDFEGNYGTTIPKWYTAQNPVIVDEKAILAPCGTDVLMMAVDCDTGDILWETPNDRGWKMSHSSIIPMTLLGKKMYVYHALGGIVGVSAEAADEGKLLWDSTWSATVVAPSPIRVSDNQIFMTAGYAAGNMLLQLSESNGEYSIEILYENAPSEGLACEQHTPIFKDGALYSIMPKDGGSLKQQFVKFDLDGNLLWSSGVEKRFGLGPFMIADDKFYILGDDGTLTLLDASAGSYTQLAEAKLEILDGHDAWSPFALVENRLLLRNHEHLICIDVGLT